MWSRVNREQRAAHGVGFIISPYKAKDLVTTELISERLMKIDIREGNKITNYIQVYAPCNDSYSEEEEDSFFGEYLDTINYQPDKENLCVMGDFNSRVGK